MRHVSGTPLWRGMTRQQLDDAYNNSAAVPNSAEKIAEWGKRSAAFRAHHPQLLDQPYTAHASAIASAFSVRVSRAPRCSSSSMADTPEMIQLNDSVPELALHAGC
jgi:hypothetical protein